MRPPDKRQRLLHPRRWLLLVLVGLFPVGWSVALSTGESVAADEGAPFRESFSLRTDEAVVRQFQDVQDYIQKERWEQAAELLVRIAREKGEILLRREPGWYVNSGIYCNLLAASLPRAGLAAYRQKIDHQAQAWFREAQRTGNDAPLWRIVRQAFCSSYGDDALLLLGSRCWERGDISTARRCWKMLLPPRSSGRKPAAAEEAGSLAVPLQYPDASVEAAVIRARLVLCEIMLNRRDEAARLLAEFKRRHPAAEGQLAGREGKLADILTAVLKESARWKQPNEEEAAYLTFAGNPARNGAAPSSPAVGVRHWQRKLFPPAFPSPDDVPPLHRRYPAFHPVVWKRFVFTADESRIFGYRLRDGGPAFLDDVSHGKSASAEQRAVLYAAPEAGHLPPPSEPVRRTPFFTLTIHTGRLYARLGSAITGRAKNEVRASRSRLVCLDLEAGEGKLLWKIDSRTVGPGWEFDGCPLATETHLFCVVRRRSPETQIAVACFRAENGELLWQSTGGTAIAAGDEDENQISHLLLTLAEGRLYLATHLGAVLAWEAHDGFLLWAATYPADESPTRIPQKPDRSGLAPCLFHGGTIFAAPSDAANLLLALNAETGQRRWQRRLRGGVEHLLGLRHHRLVVSGRRLWGLDPETGRIVWNTGFADPAGFGFGRGMLAGKEVFWPLRKEILVVDCRSGRLTRRIRLHALQQGEGGNLVVLPDGLLVSEPSRLVRYGTNAGRLAR